MASSLLRLGRPSSLKCLRLDTWGVLRTYVAAPLCTQAKEPAKKTKASVKSAAESVSSFTSPAAGGAAVADASKPAPGPGLESTSEAAQVPSETAPPRAEGAPLAAVITDDSLTAKTGASGSGDPAAAGSSSSDSDSESDSDSDSEDEKADVIAEARKTLVPDASGRADLQEVTSGVKEESNEAKKDFIAEAQAPLALAVETRPDTAPAAADQSAMKASSADELMDSAPEICTASEAAPQISLTLPHVPDEAAAGSSPAAVEEVCPDAAEEVVTEVPMAKQAPSEVAVETTASTEAPGEAVGEPVAAPLQAAAAEQRAGVLPDPIAAEAAGEELQEHPPAEPSEEAAAAAPPPPEPEEPFDNSTYKNYQHHNYTPYTFADLDVEMAQYRLPQPSSGRQ